MNEQENQIKEMAREFKKACKERLCSNERNCYYCTAEIMFDLGYQKIDKDKEVVLSKAEKEKLLNELKYAKIERDRLDKSVKYYQGLIEDGKLVAGQEVKEARKETAKKILKWMDNNCVFGGFDVVKTWFKEQFGVEIKE